jgi:membrane protease subunit (stomatin/prohibitin family)
MRRGFGRGRRGPGLLGAMARTAVVAGTASAVAGRVAAAQGAGAAQETTRMQTEVETQVADALRAEAAAVPAPLSQPSVDDLYARLTKLGELREMGLLTEAEFAQQKARLLG